MLSVETRESLMGQGGTQNALTVFPRFLSVGTINFSARQDEGTIEGGVNITQQRMPSRVLACVRSVRHKVLVAASNERSCLSRDLWCGVSWHPSRLYSALDCPLCHGVSTFAPGAPPTLCEFHYCVGTIRGRAQPHLRA